MNFITYILAFVIIILSVKPGVMTISLSLENQESCCSTINARCNIVSNSENLENQSEHHEIGICNPFQSCGSCLLICENTLFHPTIPTINPIHQNFGYRLLLDFPIHSDFWKPPRLV